VRRFPVNTIGADMMPPGEQIMTGYAAVAKLIVAAAKGRALTVAIDGMPGQDWAAIAEHLAEAVKAGWSIHCSNSDALQQPVISTLFVSGAVRTPEELGELFAPYLAGGPVFGRVCDRELSECFDDRKCSALVDEVRAARATHADIVLLMGPGALLPQFRPLADVSFYWDATREALGACHCSSAGATAPAAAPAASDQAEWYRRSLYVDWPMHERHKRSVLSGIGGVDYYVDSTRAEPRIVSRAALDRLLAAVARQPFRCKPYFQPGVWGGQRLKEAAGLPDSVANSAWDFEIVAPENSILLGVEGESDYIDIPFHVIMWAQAGAILGRQAERDFGDFFPVRINYLDTMGGSDLSTQVHPQDLYIREHFGETIGQHESYYVVETTPGAKVHLGLKNGVTLEAFAAAIHAAETDAIPFDRGDFVNSWDARSGDYFMIPAGTVHCSGKGNLVLEISSTPYWYTFKLYDYLRPDLNGRPRPINSAHGLAVLDCSRNETWVRAHLLAEPVLVRSECGGDEYFVGTNYLVFYAVNRLHVRSEIADDTRGSVHLLILARGEQVWVISEKTGQRIRLDYLEAFVVPAAVGAYRLVNETGGEVQVLKVYLKR
jgi:mannose-6-phosphate isomerase class I